MCGTSPFPSSRSSFTGTTVFTSSKPRRITRRLSSTIAQARRASLNHAAFPFPLAREQGRGAEEGAQERGALHAVTPADVRRLGPRDREGVEHEQFDPAVDEGATRSGGQRLPEGLGREVGLDDEHAAFGQTGERIAVPEDVGVGREHDVDVPQLAVEPDGLVREHQRRTWSAGPSSRSRTWDSP